LALCTLQSDNFRLANDLVDLVNVIASHWEIGGNLRLQLTEGDIICTLILIYLASVRVICANTLYVSLQVQDIDVDRGGKRKKRNGMTEGWCLA
jgi:hypothetical protein